MNDKKIRVQVSSPRESATSYGALVDLMFNEKGEDTSASRLEWFPKSLCEFEEIDCDYDHFGKSVTGKKWFITAPKWLLDKKNINYEKQKTNHKRANESSRNFKHSYWVCCLVNFNVQSKSFLTMSTEQIFRLNNFHLLNEILDKDFGVIECSSITNPNQEVFNQPIKPKNYGK